MKYFNLLLLAFALAVGPAALSGCETEPDVYDGTEAELEDAGAAVEDAAIETGDAIEAGAAETEDAVEGAIDDAENTVDENIDLGDNAGTPEVDDNN